MTTYAGNGTCSTGTDGRALQASFGDPMDVAFDSAGNLFVADYYIRKIDTSGNATTLSTYRDGLRPGAITVDSTGTVYWTTTSQVWKKGTGSQPVLVAGASDGSAVYTDGPGSSARFNFGVSNVLAYGGILVNKSGTIFVSDTSNNVIRKIDSANNVSTFAGTRIGGLSDGPAASALFSGPRGMCVDPTGNILVADRGKSRVRRTDAGGNVSTLYTSVYDVDDVECDSLGHIYTR